jgi:DNA invertase Pin-like site-specific DNA recombinase
MNGDAPPPRERRRRAETTTESVAATTDSVAEAARSEGATDVGSLPENRRRIVAYARVSTKDQDLDIQRGRFAAFCAAKGVELVTVESDKLSGKNIERPGLQRALSMLEEGRADGLLVVKLDRLTRDAGDFEGLLERYFLGRFELMSIGDSIDTRTATGRLVLRITIAVAEWERETIAERTVVGIAHHTARGGGTPRIEGAALERILALAAAGLSNGAIAAQLAEEGVPTRKGGRWAKETVRKVRERARGMTQGVR